MRYGKLIYGPVNSGDYGVYVADVNDSDKPKRDYTSYSVPGRSRDLHFDNGRYENITRKYTCVIQSSAHGFAEDAVDRFTSLLMRPSGYQRIEDTLHPEYFKLGEFVGGTVPKFYQDKNTVHFELSFDCDARKWLRSGEVEKTLPAGTTKVWNPGTEDATPIFIITGNGYIEIGSKRITITSNTDTMIIDCDLGDAYSQEAHSNLNSKIQVSGAGDFPVLMPGFNNVKVSGLTSCTMIPRWNSL